MFLYCFKCGLKFITPAERRAFLEDGHDPSDLSYCSPDECDIPVPVQSDTFHRAVWVERAVRQVFTDAEFRRFGITDDNGRKFNPADPIIRITRRFAGGSVQQEVVILNDVVEVQYLVRPYRVRRMASYTVTHRIFQAPTGLHSRIVDAVSVNFRLLEKDHEVQLQERTSNRFSDSMIQFGGTQ